MTKAAVSFENIGELSSWQRIARSFNLARASKAAPGLTDELPYTARNYSSTPMAWHRLGYVGSLVEAGDIAASIIHCNGDVVGVASAHRFGLPALRSVVEEAGVDVPETATAVEVSYWHRDLYPYVSADADTTIVGELNRMALGLAGEGGGDWALSWHVTIPGDKLKRYACEQNNMVPIGEPRPYDIEDGVQQPRQLWVKALGYLS